MILDEAIKYAEEVAEEKNNDAELFKKVKATDDKILKCLKCAEEHRQLAEWIKELKQLREQTKWIPVGENPLKDGKYRVTRRTYGKSIVDTVSYAKDLYTIDKFDFADKKGKGGWYGYDSDFGYYEVTESIIAWMPLPQPYVPDINVGKMEESEVKNDTRTINKFKFSCNYATTSRYKHNASYNSG